MKRLKTGGIMNRAGSGRPAKTVIPETAPEDVPVPDGLSDEARVVWERLAPFALQERTLVPQTADRFSLLCQTIVLERQMATKMMDDGLTFIAVTVDGAGVQHDTLKAHPLCAQQRGMLQRVETGMMSFKLAPMGRPIPPHAKAEVTKVNALDALKSTLHRVR